MKTPKIYTGIYRAPETTPLSREKGPGLRAKKTVYSGVTKTWILRFMLLLCSLSGGLRAQTFAGPVTIATQADLDAFIDGANRYRVVTGRFWIAPTAVLTNFDNLSDLETINGELNINNYLSDQPTGDPLSEFESLITVGGNLRVGTGTPGNQGITGLTNPSLQTVGRQLQIRQSTELTTISLPGLISTGGNFIVDDLPQLAVLQASALTSVGGNFNLRRLGNLANLDGLDGVNSIARNLVLSDLPNLTTIDGLGSNGNGPNSRASLEVSQFAVQRNALLTSLGSTTVLVTNEFRLIGNPLVQTLPSSLRLGTNLNRVRINGNALLNSTALSFNGGSTEVLEFTVDNNPVLASTGTQQFKVTRSINLTNNDALEQLYNFRSTDTLSGTLNLNGNDVIDFGPDATGETRLRDLVAVVGAVNLRGNSGVSTLATFANLNRVGSIEIRGVGDNGGLSSLDELVSLQTIENALLIRNNANLSDCCTLACDVEVAGQPMNGDNPNAVITNNAGGCEDKPTFVSSCRGEPNATCFAPLPVEFLAFTGNLGARSITLEFTTATETENAYFQIERSLDGSPFATIGRLTGAGNSQVALNYTFEDHAFSPGINYYRIRQVDFDGTRSFSRVIAIDAGGPLPAVSLFPNPASGTEVRLQLGANWSTEGVAVEVFSAAGLLLYRGKSIGVERLALPTAHLPPGLYTVRVTDRKLNVSKRLVIR